MFAFSEAFIPSIWIKLKQQSCKIIQRWLVSYIVDVQFNAIVKLKNTEVNNIIVAREIVLNHPLLSTSLQYKNLMYFELGGFHREVSKRMCFYLWIKTCISTGFSLWTTAQKVTTKWRNQPILHWTNILTQLCFLCIENLPDTHTKITSTTLK